MLQDKLYKLRKEYDISAERLAKFLQVQTQDIYDWEQGRKQPTLHQAHQIAELFDIHYEELVYDEERTLSSNTANNVKQKGKNKNKKKTKKKRKTKKVTKKQVEKKQNWPLIIFLLLFLCAAGIGGVIYWKYGDEYTLLKKNSYTIAQMVGSYQSEITNDEQQATLSLRSDASFTLSSDSCSQDENITGTWSVKDSIITLTTSTSTYNIHIKSTNQLKMSTAIGCGIEKNTVFVRGTANTNETLNDSNSSNTNDTQTDESTKISLGIYANTTTTLNLTNINGTLASFTLSSIDEQSDKQALISITNGVVTNKTITFSFQDDGYGNVGSGTIVFDNKQAVFQIVLDSDTSSEYQIATSGTLLMK